MRISDWSSDVCSSDLSLLSGAISKFASPPLDRAAPDVSRTREGRLLSRSRYRNAESFFLAIGELRFPDTGDLLYQTGIVAQMALSSHLLDVGFRSGQRRCGEEGGIT